MVSTCDNGRVQPTAKMIKNTFSIRTALALEKEREKDASKRHTMSHPPDHIPELDSPRQSRSPLKKDKKEQVSSKPRATIVDHFAPKENG